jgi:hypothetical protein
VLPLIPARRLKIKAFKNIKKKTHKKINIKIIFDVFHLILNH